MPVPIPYSPILVRDPKDTPGLVQGQMPQSINEWYVALALDKLHMDYSYQYPIGGGRAIRSGQVIDFVVWTALGGIPVFVQGAYWHDIRHDPEGELKQEAARQYFRNDPVLIWDYESDTRDKAYVVVRDRVYL